MKYKRIKTCLLMVSLFTFMIVPMSASSSESLDDSLSDFMNSDLSQVEYVRSDSTWDSYEELLDHYIKKTFEPDMGSVFDTYPPVVAEAMIENDETYFPSMVWGMGFNKETLDQDAGKGWTISYELMNDYIDEMPDTYIADEELGFWSDYKADVEIQEGYHVPVSFMLETKDGKKYPFEEMLKVIKIDGKWYFDCNDINPALLYSDAFFAIDNNK